MGDTVGHGRDAWAAESARLHEILDECGLGVAKKWDKPCFVAEGTNIAILQPMKSHLALMFFKGALLTDPDGVLHAPGPNSRFGKRLHFTSVADVAALESSLRAFVVEALEIEREGRTVDTSSELVLVEELAARLADDAALKAAFEGLTPGRQRGYNLHFSAPKQSKTRVARITKYAPKILAGKGLRDR